MTCVGRRVGLGSAPTGVPVRCACARGRAGRKPGAEEGAPQSGDPPEARGGVDSRAPGPRQVHRPPLPAALRSNPCGLRPDPCGRGPRRLRVRHRLGAEVSAGCVPPPPGPWERVGTHPFRAIEEVTHGDKETPGNGTGAVRAPPGLGDRGAPEVGFLSAPGVCPPDQHSDYLAGTKCSPGSRDVTSGGPGRGVRPPPRSAPSGARSGGPGPARAGLAPAGQLEKNRGRTHLSSSAPRLRRGRGAALRSGSGDLRRGAAGPRGVQPTPGARDPERSHLEAGTAGGSGTLTATSGGSRRPSPNCRLRGRLLSAQREDEPSFGRRRPARATVQHPLSGALGGRGRPSLAEKNLGIGFGALGCPGGSSPPPSLPPRRGSRTVERFCFPCFRLFLFSRDLTHPVLWAWR
ncbi:unnamed protein product [Nyctereutes procyonoides]|uniref:(raccoon dog) hypothetical protein n=1 Tax=Nyctereutes procyonoides TaxID=34880 RepID=A0A811YLQ8_NYCPR|nr:unnamed protein product [Nyctereutes procyonoides]